MLAAGLIGFAFGFVGSMPVAGPIAALVFARGVESRYRSGIGIAAGGAVAEAIYACLAFWGFAELLSRFPIMLHISRGLAAVVLIVLGLLFLRSGPIKKDPPKRREGWGGGFVLGFTITALNPTLIATWSAAATTLLSSGLVRSEPALALPFGICAALGIVSWFALLLYLVGRLRGRFSERSLGRILQVMGVFLLGVAAYFVVLLIRDLV